MSGVGVSLLYRQVGPNIRPPTPRRVGCFDFQRRPVRSIPIRPQRILFDSLQLRRTQLGSPIVPSLLGRSYATEPKKHVPPKIITLKDNPSSQIKKIDTPISIAHRGAEDAHHISFRKNPWAWIKAGARHYWIGTKLLFLEIRTALKIVNSITQGNRLSRRERRQLLRTFNDLLRMIPFSVFVIVPFAELALPLALKLFPNMLPSTFADKMKAEEDMKRKLRARIEIAKFMQDAAEDMGTRQRGKVTKAGLDFEDFMDRVKKGQGVNNEDILKFSKAFEDEFTLDNATRPQLIAMCKYMGIPPYGADPFLRFQLSLKLKQIKSDDQMILDEGITKMTMEELQSALRARGMRWTGTKIQMRRKLEEWLNLSITHNLPASILILSRALIITESETTGEALKEALSSLPEELIEEVKLSLDEKSGTATADQKLEVLQSQNEKIDEELEEMQDQIKSIEKTAGPYHLNMDKLQSISEALSIMASASSVENERDELKILKADRAASQQMDELKKEMETISKQVQEEVNRIKAAEQEEANLLKEAQEPQDKKEAQDEVTATEEPVGEEKGESEVQAETQAVEEVKTEEQVQREAEEAQEKEKERQAQEAAERQVQEEQDRLRKEKEREEKEAAKEEKIESEVTELRESVPNLPSDSEDSEPDLPDLPPPPPSEVPSLDQLMVEEPLSMDAGPPDAESGIDMAPLPDASPRLENRDAFLQRMETDFQLPSEEGENLWNNLVTPVHNLLTGVVFEAAPSSINEDTATKEIQEQLRTAIEASIHVKEVIPMPPQDDDSEAEEPPPLPEEDLEESPGPQLKNLKSKSAHQPSQKEIAPPVRSLSSSYLLLSPDQIQAFKDAQREKYEKQQEENQRSPAKVVPPVVSPPTKSQKKKNRKKRK
eukprot:TRINITY_DN7649_c0_g1_i4.p1 TRINITY_DN7649_c0_g1~~TRINITY_DN7649_c0_g1_i4.p1  ORF type:complete len:891 (+),score=255.14 TRINITY_DN7649_c0_g1_i4:86-2758(+)